MKALKRAAAPLVLAALAAGLCAPAQAKWTPIRADIVRDGINDLDGDIDRADRNDTISEREAADLRTRVRGLRDQFHRLNSNGLTRPEVRQLQNRTNHIRSRLNLERVDWDRHAG